MMRLDKDEGVDHGVGQCKWGWNKKGKKLHMGVTIVWGVLYLLQITMYILHFVIFRYRWVRLWGKLEGVPASCMYCMYMYIHT